MSQLPEKARKIQSEISVYKRKEFENSFDRDKEVAIENAWGASYLYAALLEKTNLQRYFSITRDELNTLYKEFNKEVGGSCDLNSLFSRNWLRLVCGKVHIAGTIRCGVLNIEKVAGLDNEFAFLSEVQKQNDNKKIPESEFLMLRSEYQIQHECKLDLDRATKAQWLETKDNHVSIHSLIYYEPLLKYVDDFLFLKVLVSGKESGMYISKDMVTKIFSNHQVVFPLTPSLNTFLENEVFIEDDDNYVLNFRNSKMAFHGIVHDKAGALLWEKLIQNTVFKDDKERIIFWYDRVVSRMHWCDISHSFSLKSKLRFLDAATEILLNENDLSAGEEEFKKIMLDTGHRLSNLVYVLSSKKNEPKFPSGQDIFSLYEGLKELDDKWQGQLMFEQGSRSVLTYFIHQVIRNDPKGKYEQIFKLIASGPEKPFLLWKTARVIYYWEPDIIPFFLLNKLTASLGSILLLKAKGNGRIFYEKPDIFARTINENFRLSCDFVATSNEITNEDKARIIFQNLLPVVEEKFVIIGPQLDKQKQHKKESSEIVVSLQSIIENTTLPGNYYSGGVSFRKLMYSSLLNELYDQIKAYNPVDYFGYTSVTLPFARMDMLIWLSQLVDKSGVENSEKATHNYNICNLFLEDYVGSMNAGYRKMWDYEKEQYVDRVPVWSNQQPNLELIRWMYIFLELEKEKLLDDFLNPPELKFRAAKDKYDEYNGFVSNKLRTHLAILLIGYNSLYNSKPIFAAKKAPVDIVLNKLESKITSIITQYCKDEPERARLDIFNHLLERTFWSTDREELLPVIGSTINRFKKENKETIIKDLVQTDQLVRSFKLLDYMASESDKSFLLALITENDIEQFFLNSYPNDAEYVLQKLVEENKFEEKAKQALDIWEKRETRGMQNEKDQHLILCFRMRLLLAYHELDKEKINSIPVPSLHNSGIESNKFSAYAEKDFYRALIYLHNAESEKAYNIFNDQLKAAADDRPVLGLNRFAAKLKWADQTENLAEKRKLFQEAIDEWNAFEIKLSNELDIDYIKDKIWYNKLHAYLGLKNDDSFDVEFAGLDKPFQLRPDFLELRIKNLMERDMQHQAESLLAEAEEYHRLSNGQAPDSIVSLRDLTDTEETHKYLQNIYHRIFSMPPEQLIKILPGNINKFSTLEEFLLSEIVGSVTDMLTYINSISDIKLEDKYSDLIVLSLNNRFKHYGWHASPNRGGSPASGKSGLGLIDFSISSRNDRMAICEALQLKGTNRTEVQNHNFKIFSYDPARNLFFVITYFKDNNNKFSDAWEQYKTDVSNSVIFPTRFKLASNGLEDISEKFGTNTIMIAKSIHSINTPIYHVFININYQIHPINVKGKKTKSKKIVSDTNGL